MSAPRGPGDPDGPGRPADPTPEPEHPAQPGQPGQSDRFDQPGQSELERLRQDILDRVAEYHELAFARRPFVPGQTPVPVSGKVFDADEMQHLTDAALDFWLTTGRFADQFEAGFAARMGVEHALLCNSGSSANLLAATTLVDPSLGDRALRPGDEVITVAGGFPTTLAPLLQNGLVPVFLDLDLRTYNVDVTRLAEAVGPRTRAVMLAHTLGNPFGLDHVVDLCRRHGLMLVEDTCDAVGATYRGRPVGSYGDLATVSFYPAHHLTMGEGGAVLTSRGDLKTIVESLRDWGRDCWCAPGAENTCGRRFGWQAGDLPAGYDHKYIYRRPGYNLKATDLQAAVGVAQLAKLDGFVAARRRNWAYLRAALADVPHLVLPEPTPESEPSWFGFVVTLAPDAPFDRWDLVRWLEERRIATRLVFGGNLLRQPAFQGIQHRVVGSLATTDLVAERSFWVGCWPGLTEDMLAYIAASIRDFVSTPVALPRPAALRRSAARA
ncbi:MAG: lipopolysaccharide biosynthesis protein RfbH [Acidimicrobiales bacterium]